MKNTSLPCLTFNLVRLQLPFFMPLLLIEAGLAVLAVAAMQILFPVLAPADFKELLSVPSLLLLLFGMILNLLASISLFSTGWSLGVEMSISRRRILAAAWGAGLLFSALLLVIPLLCETVLAFRWDGFGSMLLFRIPWWGWAAMLFLAVSSACFLCAIVQVFRSAGALVLWALFMGVCLLAPSKSLQPTLETIRLEDLLAVLPWLLLAFFVAEAVAGTVMLSRASIH